MPGNYWAESEQNHLFGALRGLNKSFIFGVESLVQSREYLQIQAEGSLPFYLDLESGFLGLAPKQIKPKSSKSLSTRVTGLEPLESPEGRISSNRFLRAFPG